MRAARAAATVLVAALALIAAGCGGGGDDTSAAEQWAEELCSAVTTWTDSIQESGEGLMSSGTSSEGLQGVVDDVKSATDTLGDDIEALGTPDTDSGAEAKDAVDDLADELRGGVEEIETAVEGVSGLGEIANALTTISGTFADMGSQLAETFQTLEELDASGELEEAFRQAESCESLTE